MTLSSELQAHIDELARLAAGEGLSVNVLVRPVLCPMDDKTSAFAALMGAFMGQSSYVNMTAPTTVAGDEETVGSLEERMKAMQKEPVHDCRCGGVCACHGGNGSEPSFGEPMGFGIG